MELFIQEMKIRVILLLDYLLMHGDHFRNHTGKRAKMNREVLFRGKRLDNGEWIRGDLITTPFIRNTTQQNIIYILDVTKADYDCFEDLVEDNGIFEVDPETVCQYTGLNDKNGRKIFDGDILHFVNNINDNKWLCVVEFLEGSFICRYDYKNGELGEYNHFNSWHEKVEWEVIGNIFENQELLGGTT